MINLCLIDFVFNTLQLVRILREQQSEKSGNLHQFDHECTLVVCNKWDMVSSGEDMRLWTTFSEKLQDILPTLRHVDIKEQMFRMSVKEVSNMHTTHLMLMGIQVV